MNTGHYAFSDLCATFLLGKGDCGPGTDTLSQDDAHAVALRYGLPFLLRYVAGRRRFGALLTSAAAPPTVMLLEAHPRR